MDRLHHSWNMLAVLKPTAVNSILAEVRALQAEAGKSSR